MKSIHSKKDIVFNEETEKQSKIIMDPVAWGEKYLRDPDAPGKSLKLRWYQKQIIGTQPEAVDYDENTGKFVFERNKKVYRMARRMGKTVALAVEALWRAFTHSDQKILIITPYKSQVMVIFEKLEKLIGSGIVDGSLKTKRYKSFKLVFTNGSQIQGYTANVAAGARAAESIRGEGANVLIIDEVDYIPDHAIDAIMAIFSERTDAEIIVSSTPSGKRGFYYNICTQAKKLEWEHFHFQYKDSPVYNVKKDKELKDTMTTEGYCHEIMSNFGEEVATVFRHEDIDASLTNYFYKDTDVIVQGKIKKYKGTLNQYNSNNTYIMGVDWNMIFGVAVIILEYIKDEDKYRIWYEHRINKKEMSQTTAVKWIIDFHNTYKMNWIYVDKGYGEVQIELLYAYGKRNPITQLHKIVKPVDFAGNVEIFNNITKKEEKKRLKYFAVNEIHTLLANGLLILPFISDDKDKLVGQLREYRVKSSTKTGEPLFVDENDHFIAALMCSCYGFFKQSDDSSFKKHITNKVIFIKSRNNKFEISRVSNPDEKHKESIFKRLNIKKRGGLIKTSGANIRSANTQRKIIIPRGNSFKRASRNNNVLGARRRNGR
jgi:DNA polymerase III delta prime subunit